MFTGEVNIELAHSSTKRVRSEFLVHVHSVSTSEISKEYAVVLDVVGILLCNLTG